MRLITTMALLVTSPVLTAWAQEDAGGLGGYDAIDIEAGHFVGNFDGRIDELDGGVKIRLVSDNPDKPPLPIKASHVKFDWPEDGGGSPSRIVLQGNVVIEHPEATVRSEKADWDFGKGILVITGNPVMATEQVPELRGEKILLNFNTGRFEVEGGKAQRIRLSPNGSASGAKSPSYSLRVSDIRDWPAFLTRIRKEAGADEPSPGKRVVSLLDTKTRAAVENMPIDVLLEDKDALLKAINPVITNPKLYDKDAWNGVALTNDVKALLGQDELSASDRIHLNRALFEAAYPDYVTKRGE